MKIQFHPRIWTLACLIMLLPAPIKSGATAYKQGKFIQVRSVPISKRRITARFQTQDRAWVEVSQREGMIIRIKRERDQQTFGLAFRIVDEQSRLINMRLVWISTVVKNGIALGEKLEEIASTNIRENIYPAPDLVGLPFELAGVRLEDDNFAMQTDELRAKDGDSVSCCVTSDGLTFCGDTTKSSDCLRECC